MDPRAISMLMGSSNQGGLGAALPGFLQGIFGNSGRPYEKAGDIYSQYFNQAREAQNPFVQAGNQGLGNYQDWASKMKDPSSFINNLMSGYQASPHSQYLQQQSQRAATNYGSASGLTGSTPLLQQIQQNSGNIASGDMQNWLQNVLGINTEYGKSQQDLSGMGQHAADFLSNLFNSGGENMAQTEFGRYQGQQQDRNSFLSGIGKFLGG